MPTLEIEFHDSTQSIEDCQEQLQTALQLAGFADKISIRTCKNYWTDIQIGDSGIGITLYENPDGQPIVVDEWWSNWSGIFDNQFEILNSLIVEEQSTTLER